MRQITLSTSIWIQKLFFCSNLAELGIDIDGKANETSADDDAIFCLCTYSFDNSKLQLFGENSCTCIFLFLLCVNNSKLDHIVL